MQMRPRGLHNGARAAAANMKAANMRSGFGVFLFSDGWRAPAPLLLLAVVGLFIYFIIVSRRSVFICDAQPLRRARGTSVIPV